MNENTKSFMIKDIPVEDWKSFKIKFLQNGFETYNGQVRNDLNILDFVIIEGTGPQNNFSDVEITVTFETTIFESVSNGIQNNWCLKDFNDQMVI